MMFKRAVFATLFLLALIPGRASADTLIVPFWGVNFGGDSGKTFSSAAESKQQTFGASASFFGGGVIGIEADFGYSPDFFGKTDAGGSSVLTMVGNVVLAVPFGGQKGFGVRPYGLRRCGCHAVVCGLSGSLRRGRQQQSRVEYRGWSAGVFR